MNKKSNLHDMLKLYVVLIIVITFVLPNSIIMAKTEQGSFSGYESSTNDLIIEYSFEHPRIEKIEIDGIVYDQVNMMDAPGTGRVGEPYLPARGAQILLPPDTQVDKIYVILGEKVSLGTNYNILPVAEPIRLSDIGIIKVSPIKDETAYGTNEEFPGELFSIEGTHGFRGYPILFLKLNPVHYIPSSGDLFYYKEMTVCVKTVEAYRSDSLFRGLEKDREAVYNRVDNPEITKEYSDKMVKSGSSETYDMLIITNDEFKPGFEPLKQAHDAEGTSTLLQSLNEMFGKHDMYEADEIRDYIRNAYNNLGIEYVLIGGDTSFVDDWDIVPSRQLFFLDNIYPGLSTFGASDLYYSCLDGSYNSNDDDYWGVPGDGEDGGEVDLVAEVYVGRACVDNIEEVENFVDKTIAYMNTPFSDPYLKEALMVGEYLGSVWWPNEFGGFYQMNELIDGCSDPPPSTTGIPTSIFNFNKIYDYEGYMKQEVIDISDYTGAGFEDVNIGFRLTSDDDPVRWHGLYIDDVEIIGDGNRLFFDDMESGVNGWTHSGSGDEWELGTLQNYGPVQVQSGSQCWGTDLDDTYEMQCNQRLISPSVDLSSVEEAQLCFYRWYFIEGGEYGNTDYGYVEISDDEATWNTLSSYTAGAWKKEDLLEIMDSDVHLINHIGHGNLDNAMKMYTEDFDTLNNDKFSFVYSQACLAGSMDNVEWVDPWTGYRVDTMQDCVAEHLTVKTDHGAFAAVMNAREGWGYPWTTDGPSQRYHREFWNQIFANNKKVIGEVNQLSKEANIYRLDDDYMRWVFFGLNLFGDPAVKLKTHRVYNQNKGTLYFDIQDAINDANPQDTISVSGGTVYYENLEINIPVKIIGENKETTIIDGTQNGNVIQINTDGVTISGFTLQNSNECGIYSSFTAENVIINNIFKNNRRGLRFDCSSDNMIYHNQFIDNDLRVYDSGPGVNMWDAGYPNGGNYWSHLPIDPLKTDRYQGPDQDFPGSDGIRDQAYNIEGSMNSKDRYPLVDPDVVLISDHDWPDDENDSD